MASHTTSGALPALAQERKVITAIPGPKSQEILTRRAAATSAGLGLTFPVVIERTQGAILQDVDGNSLIDFGSGIGVTTVGNTNDRVAQRVMDQTQKSLTHASLLRHTLDISKCASS